MSVQDLLIDEPPLAYLPYPSGRGDRASFAELYDATAPSSFALAAAILGDTDRAEQDVLDAYLEAWRTASRYAGVPGVSRWIAVIVLRHARERLRCAVATDPKSAAGLKSKVIFVVSSSNPATCRTADEGPATRAQGAVR